MTEFHDPTLDELLGDPVTQAIMRADRVDPLKLAAMLRSLAREIAGRSSASATPLVKPAGTRFDRSPTSALSRPAGVFQDDVFQDPASCRMSAPGTRSQHCGAP